MSKPSPTHPRIVTGYDGSPASRAALSHAVRRAGEDGRVTIVHAFRVSAGISSGPEYDEIRHVASARARRRVEDLVDEVPELAAADWGYQIVLDSPARAILRVAEEERATEIVIGTRGAGRARTLLGSVAQKVLHGARCPVFVIPARAVTERSLDRAAS